MSVDTLQLKIRKLKNPSVIDLNMNASMIPGEILEQAGAFLPAYEQVCMDYLACLQETVPAVRFSLSRFALLGPEGLLVLERLLRQATNIGYYALLDTPAGEWELLESQLAGGNFNGLIIKPYLGSDSIKPIAKQLKETEKTLFVALRTPNRSASELQDLMTGSRFVYQAAADIVSRLGESLVSRCGYSQLGGTCAANAPDSLRLLRSKNPKLFLLVDGYDYPNANAKNCSLVFDQFGHGAAVCAGETVTAAWKETGQDHTIAAVEAAKKMQKNILRYITIL